MRPADRHHVDRVFLAGNTAHINIHSQEPSAMHTYDVTVTTSASPEVVWKLLVHAASWPLWSKVDSLDTTRSVDLDPGGDDGAVPSGLSERDAP
ncbi:hypothetical protein ACWGCC_16195 [Streptomyces nigrescens]